MQQSSSWHSLHEAASESANSNIVQRAINELLANDDLRQQLASGLGAQAVSLCRSIEAAQRIQKILIAACVVEANDAHHNEETTPSSELISIGGALAELMLVFHDCYETCGEYFKQAFMDQVSHLVSKPSIENSTFSCHLVVGAFLRVAEYPDQFQGVHESISFTAVLYAYEVASLVNCKEQITDQMYKRIIEMYTFAFSDYQIERELFEKSSDLLLSIGSSRFHSFVAPILVETLENITKTSTAIACLQSYSQFIELLDKCGMNSVLPHYFCDDGFLSIMIDTSMELIIEMNTEDVTIMVYELLCTIIRSCPEGGVIVAVGALVDALNVDGGVFKSSEECQLFVEHVTKCLHQVAVCIQDLMDQDPRNKRAISNEDTIRTVYEITNIMKVLKNSETLDKWTDILTLLDQYNDMDDESTAESTSSSKSKQEEVIGRTSSRSSGDDDGMSVDGQEEICEDPQNNDDEKEEQQKVEEEGTRPANGNEFNAFYMGTTHRSFASFGNLSVCQTSHSEASSRYGDKFRTQHNVYDADLMNGAVEISSASSISDQSSSDDDYAENDVEDENDTVDDVNRERLSALVKAVSTRSFSIDDENEVEDAKKNEEEDGNNIEQQRKLENGIDLEEDSKVPAKENIGYNTNSAPSSTAIRTKQSAEYSLEKKIKNKLEAEDRKFAPPDLDLKIKAKVGMHSLESHSNEDKKPAPFETDGKVHRNAAPSIPKSSKNIEDRINAKLHSESKTYANLNKFGDTATDTFNVSNASRSIEDSINNKLKYEDHHGFVKPNHNDDDQKHTTDDEITRRIDDKLNARDAQITLLKHESDEDMLESTLNAFPRKSTAEYSIENRIKSKLQVGASPFLSQNNEDTESKIREKINSHQSKDESKTSINKSTQREINEDFKPSSSTSSSEESPLTNTHASKQQIILDKRICSKLEAQHSKEESDDQSEFDKDEQDGRDENMLETEPLLELDVENQASSDGNVHREKKVIDTESASGEDDDKLVVAMAIEDEDDNLNEARNYDPSTKGKLSRSLIRWTLVAFIAAVIVTLTLVLLLSKTKLKENEEFPPTQSPTSNLQGEIANSIIEMFGEQAYSDPTKSYGKAFAWIMQDNYAFSKFQELGDVAEAARNSAKSTFDLQQRFVCALFYFKLKGNGWESCSASFDYSDTKCNYKNREQVIEERSSWLSAVDECLWGGLICNNGKIIGLDLNEMNLHGTIPTEIVRLNGLQVISLVNNTIHGSLPPIIGELSQLLDLDLHWNKMSGELPRDIYNLRNLIVLNLGYNAFNGTLSEELGNLEQLKGLHLKANTFVGSIPSAIGDLDNLEYLTLSDNLFTSWPEDVIALTNLRSLWIDRNEFKGRLHLPVATELEELVVEINQFNGSLPDNLYKANKLKYIKAGFNNFSGKLPDEIGNLKKLRLLQLWDNSFTGNIPLSLGTINTLEMVYLSHNNFDGVMPESICSLWDSELRELDADCRNDFLPGDEYYGEVEVECPASCCSRCCNPGKNGICY